jgi:hypothetical protein
MDKIRVIKRSLRCFNIGWFALFPFIGIVPALMAIMLSRKLKTEVGREWNPARKYVLWGYFMGWIGLGLTLVLAGVITFLVGRHILEQP